MSEIHIIGNSVILPPIERMSNHNNDHTIIFVGKMSYEPNIVAVTYFVKEIFPQLRAMDKSLEFIVIGANPSQRVLALRKFEGVKITGFVDSIEPYFQKASVVVAPMLTGAGIQNKIIQAMSYGCCVVTTSVGAEGLQITNDELFIEDSAEKMVSQISVLLNNRNLRISTGLKARGYVESNLSREVIIKQFMHFMGKS